MTLYNNAIIQFHSKSCYNNRNEVLTFVRKRLKNEKIKYKTKFLILLY